MLLVVAPDIDKPSHLWMRRLCTDLAPHSIEILTNQPVASTIKQIASKIHYERTQPRLSSRALFRLGLTTQDPWCNPRSLGFAKIVERRKPKATILHFLPTAVDLADAIASSATPTLVFCHGYDVTWEHKDRFGNPTHPTNYIDRILKLPPNVTFVANSQCTADKLTGIGIQPNRILRHYLGVPIAPKQTRRATPNRTHILYLGRLVDFKGPIETIRAFDEACKRGINAVLTIAGDGPLMQECKSLARDSRFGDRIRLAGTVDAKQGAELRQESHIFTAHSQTGILSKQEEAYGVSFVEAMSASLPIVSGVSGSLPEIVRHGVEGLLFTPGSIDQHASFLTELCNNQPLRESLGERARDRAERVFSESAARESIKCILANVTS